MVSAVVVPLNSTVLLVRFSLMAPRIDERFRFTDVYMDLERDIADFLGTETSILYSQGLSIIPCVISAKRGDVIVADHGINLQISLSTVC